MADTTATALAEDLRAAAHPLIGEEIDYRILLDAIGDARIVLIGDGTHGTHEFYRERAEITRQLIMGKGFNAVAVEADWPDAYRVNRYVRGHGGDRTSLDALAGFERFPTWMWRNTVMLDFVGWLRGHNQRIDLDALKVGFYGLDLYSLNASVQAVLEYLQKVDPEGADRARARYSCFDHAGGDAEAYGYATGLGLRSSCEDAVVGQLVELQRRAADYAGGGDAMAEDEYFFAEQNARLVMNAEQYYRSMFAGHVASWNMRDRHMAETLEALVRHLDDRAGGRSKVVVWEHTSHLGDARATEMGDRGELNVGQLVRERYSDQSFLIGFTTSWGTVTAASDWGEPPQRMRVRPALHESVEDLFHDVGVERFLLNLRDSDIADELRQERLERAIGVIYRPQTERLSHYFSTRISDQFDAVVHIDRTRALEPLEPTVEWHAGEEPPETFPTGI